MDAQMLMIIVEVANHNAIDTPIDGGSRLNIISDSL
jgi:hypothetical protein